MLVNVGTALFLAGLLFRLQRQMSARLTEAEQSARQFEAEIATQVEYIQRHVLEYVTRTVSLGLDGTSDDSTAAAVRSPSASQVLGPDRDASASVVAPAAPTPPSKPPPPAARSTSSDSAPAHILATVAALTAGASGPRGSRIDTTERTEPVTVTPGASEGGVADPPSTVSERVATAGAGDSAGTERPPTNAGTPASGADSLDEGTAPPQNDSPQGLAGALSALRSDRTLQAATRVLQALRPNDPTGVNRHDERPLWMAEGDRALGVAQVFPVGDGSHCVCAWVGDVTIGTDSQLQFSNSGSISWLEGPDGDVIDAPAPPPGPPKKRWWASGPPPATTRSSQEVMSFVVRGLCALDAQGPLDRFITESNAVRMVLPGGWAISDARGLETLIGDWSTQQFDGPLLVPQALNTPELQRARSVAQRRALANDPVLDYLRGLGASAVSRRTAEIFDTKATASLTGLRRALVLFHQQHRRDGDCPAWLLGSQAGAMLLVNVEPVQDPDGQPARNLQGPGPPPHLRWTCSLVAPAANIMGARWERDSNPPPLSVWTESFDSTWTPARVTSHVLHAGFSTAELELRDEVLGAMPVVFAGAPDIARAMGGGGNHGAIVVAESFWADLKGLHSKDLQYELAYQVLADSLYAGARPQWIVEHEWSAAFLVAQAVARDRDFEEVRRLHFWLAPR